MYKLLTKFQYKVHCNLINLNKNIEICLQNNILSTKEYLLAK